jgi:hypothetical protein
LFSEAIMPITADEARPYGPDATPEERAAIRARVRWLEDDIIEYRECPVMTPFSVDLMFDATLQAAAGLERFAILVDVREAPRPSAELREHLRERAARIESRVRHVALVADSLLIRVAAPFIFAKLPFISASIHSNREDALEALRRGGR